MSEPDFWRDRAQADGKIKRLGELRDLVTRFREIEKGIGELNRHHDNDNDHNHNGDEKRFFELKRKFREFELETLFTGNYDKQSAVLSVYPGAGGADAEDWAQMLFEMYGKYAAKRKWQRAILDENPNRRTIEIKGEYAYGYLKNEAGVHRLVRISPFSAKKLRHTSFALVEVVPDLPVTDETRLSIPEKDLKFEFSRSGGPGGQNVNKLETAVRVVHLGTGLAASSQAERSQAQNRDRALKILKAKILKLMEQQHAEELSGLRTKVKPEWGNQIRSYVLNPYQLVKDHRTEVETTQVEAVLNGELDNFIEGEIELLHNANNAGNQ